MRETLTDNGPFSMLPFKAAYRTIVADPPWSQTLMGRRRRPRDPHIAKCLPYQTMNLDAVKLLPVASLASPACHLWLWTTNQFLRAGFEVMQAWGFKYLAPIVWVKPSGCGNYFIHRTQTVLFGYRERCQFPLARYLPNVFFALPGRHSQKPEESYQLIEKVSPGPRLELFARTVRPGWQAWGDEIESLLPN
jgi:N6-adenosine-specific RNA methylase IME4